MKSLHTSGQRIVLTRGVATSTGGAVAFTELTDVPNSYSGEQGKIVRVNDSETGLEFVPVSRAFPFFIS